MYAFEGLRIQIDRARYVGIGNRVNGALDFFEIDWRNLACHQEETPDIDAEHPKEACAICPVDALRVYDGGEQVVP